MNLFTAYPFTFHYDDGDGEQTYPAEFSIAEGEHGYRVKVDLLRGSSRVRDFGAVGVDAALAPQWEVNRVLGGLVDAIERRDLPRVTALIERYVILDLDTPGGSL